MRSVQAHSIIELYTPEWFATAAVVAGTPPTIQQVPVIIGVECICDEISADRWCYPGYSRNTCI